MSANLEEYMVVANLPTDPAWFYSSLAQVTAAIVGFLGGFLILRLLGFMSEWQGMATRIETAQRVWGSLHLTIEKKNRTPGVPVPPALEADLARVWSDLTDALADRDTARMPREVTVVGAALAVFAGVGIIWPLLSLGAPTTRVQLLFLVPWTLVLLVFVALMILRARTQLCDLKNLQLWTWVQSKYDADQKEIEAQLAVIATPIDPGPAL